MKKKRRFKLGTTSFIVPDHIIPNVKFLGPYFDEIELLIFESRPDVLPSPGEINELGELSKIHDLDYNIHLPVDISLSRGTSDQRRFGAGILIDVIDRLNVLEPTTCTLHLEMPKEVCLAPAESKETQAWAALVHRELSAFLARLETPGIISVETLDYPFSIIESIVKQENTSICIDIGHGIKYGYDWLGIYDQNPGQVPIVHLHGVDFQVTPPKDHTRLDRLPDEAAKQVIDFLIHYTGTVSLEVFNPDNLKHSLNVLDRYFTDIPILSKPKRA